MKEEEYTLRKAQLEDDKITFEWANSGETRKFSFNKASIPWGDHKNWFESKINSIDCWYGIIELNLEAKGSIRFDIEDRIATISYLVAPGNYGKGIGSRLIKLGIKALENHYKDNEISIIQGFVIPENIASAKTFEKFGFNKQRVKDVFLFSKELSKNV